MEWKLGIGIGHLGLTRGKGSHRGLFKGVNGNRFRIWEFGKMRPLFRGVPIQYKLLRMTFDLQQYWSPPPPFMEINQGIEAWKATWKQLYYQGFHGAAMAIDAKEMCREWEGVVQGVVEAFIRNALRAGFRPFCM